MKRRTKFLLLTAVVLLLGGIVAVLRLPPRNTAMLFPGAVVVLEDQSWRTRGEAVWRTERYLWANANTILYTHLAAGKEQIVRRRLLPNGKFSSPEVLPVPLGSGQAVMTLSPDGKTLCLYDSLHTNKSRYALIGTERPQKPLNLRHASDELFWSSDSKSLYGLCTFYPSHFVERIAVSTGASRITPLVPGNDFVFTTITPEGRCLGFVSNILRKPGSPLWTWEVLELRGNTVITTKYQKPFPAPEGSLTLSPNGKRLLWRIDKDTFSPWRRIQKTLFKRPVPSSEIIVWQVTDIDGKNVQIIGIIPEAIRKPSELFPEWTPDSKGVHFVQDGKLMYLTVP
jgi:hypothetical protein